VQCRGKSASDATRSSLHRHRSSPQTITDMFSTIARRVVPSLRPTRLYVAAAYTQAAPSSSTSKFDEGEQAIYDKLSDHFQTSELLVQDVSGVPPLGFRILGSWL
jgi:hypothetical protein